MLYFVSDRTGWWNLYRWRDNQVEAAVPDGSRVRPAAVGFRRLASMASHPNDKLSAATPRTAVTIWPRSTPKRKRCDDIELPFSAISQVRVAADRVRFHRRVGDRAERHRRIGSGDESTRSVCADRAKQLSMPAISPTPRADRISQPNSGLTAHGYFYPPQNRDYAAPANEKPPLLVMSHGGPTSSSSGVAEILDSILDQPRHRRARCELRRQHRLRPRLSRTAERPTGASSMSMTASTARAIWRSAAKSTATAWRSAAAAPAATRRSAR